MTTRLCFLKLVSRVVSQFSYLCVGLRKNMERESTGKSTSELRALLNKVGEGNRGFD